MVIWRRGPGWKSRWCVSTAFYSSYLGCNQRPRVQLCVRTRVIGFTGSCAENYLMAQRSDRVTDPVCTKTHRVQRVEDVHDPRELLKVLQHALLSVLCNCSCSTNIQSQRRGETLYTTAFREAEIEHQRWWKALQCSFTEVLELYEGTLKLFWWLTGCYKRLLTCFRPLGSI